MAEKKNRDGQSRETDRDYSVGYGKPPRSGRFAKGTSGNPKGRPVGSKNLRDLFEDALDEEVTVSENGKRRVISKREAITKQLVNKAASGDPRSIKLLVDLLRNTGGRLDVSSEEAPLDEDDLAVMQDLIRELRQVGHADNGGGEDDDEGSDPKAT